MGHSTSKTVVVISGPSGVGKTTLCAKLVELEPRLKIAITATTRSPRPGEVDAKDYYFISKDLFSEWLKKNEIIEYTELFGELYGTLSKSVEQIIAGGDYPLLRIDVQGARSLKKLGYRGVFIFILPPDFETLECRLKTRQTQENNISEFKEAMGRRSHSGQPFTERLEKAKEELAYKDEYDFQVVNDNFNEAVVRIRKILKRDCFAG